MTWLIHQLWLTWHEIITEITIPHTITGMIAYAILHSMYALLHFEEMSLLKKLKTNRHKAAWLHIKKRHNGRFSHCTDCMAIQAHRALQ